MKNRKESHSLIRQNEQTVKKSQKHDANLQKNSTLYFQVGLIVCLLAAYGLFEMKFETKVPPTMTYEIDDQNDLYVFNEVFKPEEPVKKQAAKKKQSKVFKDPIIKEEDLPFKEDSEILDPPTNQSTLDPNSLPTLEKEPEVEPVVGFIAVEQVPVFPGCEKKKDREAQRKCMSEKIAKLVQRKFDTNLAGELGLTGKQRIQVQFMIDKTGRVTDIKTRAPHPVLGKEAKRVVDLIPDMQPGKQRDEPVSVRYNLPINFQVHN